MLGHRVYAGVDMEEIRQFSDAASRVLSSLDRGVQAFEELKDFKAPHIVIHDVAGNYGPNLWTPSAERHWMVVGGVVVEIDRASGESGSVETHVDGSGQLKHVRTMPRLRKSRGLPHASR